MNNYSINFQSKQEDIGKKLQYILLFFTSLYSNLHKNYQTKQQVRNR